MESAEPARSVESEETLESCPFCGRPPRETDRASDTTGSGHVWFLACHGGGYSAHAHQWGETREEVVAKWNRRALPGQEAGEPDWMTPELRDAIAKVDADAMTPPLGVEVKRRKSTVFEILRTPRRDGVDVPEAMLAAMSSGRVLLSHQRRLLAITLARALTELADRSSPGSIANSLTVEESRSFPPSSRAITDAQQEIKALRVAVAAALGRLPEVSSYLADQAFGYDKNPGDAGAAFNALRIAARLVSNAGRLISELSAAARVSPTPPLDPRDPATFATFAAIARGEELPAAPTPETPEPIDTERLAPAGKVTDLMAALKASMAPRASSSSAEPETPQNGERQHG